MSYKKAPYFEIIFSIIEDIFHQEEKNLAKFIGYSLQKIANYLDIDTKFIYSSHIEKDNTLKTQDICNKLEATTYINAIGGQELYSKEKKINFLKTELIKYKQFCTIFIDY